MKLTAIIFLVSLVVYFLIAWTRSKKQEEVKIKPELKPEESKKVSVEKTKKTWFWMSVQVVILLWIAFGVYLFAKWYFFPSKQIEKIATTVSEKRETVMSFVAGNKLMTEENSQAGTQETRISSLSYNDFEIIVIYTSLDGKQKTMTLTWYNVNQFYSGWIENTHPNKKLGRFKMYLVKDKKTPYELTSLTGKKIKILPHFEGCAGGNNEIVVKIFTRVSQKS